MKFLVSPMPIYDLSEVDQEALQKQQVDPATEVTQPDLMLGIDVVPQLCLRKEADLPSGFSLYSSRLGQIICGQGRIEETEQANLIFSASTQNSGKRSQPERCFQKLPPKGSYQQKGQIPRKSFKPKDESQQVRNHWKDKITQSRLKAKHSSQIEPRTVHTEPANQQVAHT